MKLQDLYDAIPNKEGVDAIFVNALFIRLKNLRVMSKDMDNQPVVFQEKTREGNPKMVKNPWWDIWRNEMQGCTQGLAELNLTPRSRKTLLGKGDNGGAPSLG